MKISEIKNVLRSRKVIFGSVLVATMIVSSVILVARYVGFKSADIKKFTDPVELGRITRDLDTVKRLKAARKFQEAEELLTQVLESVRCDACEIKSSAKLTTDAKGEPIIVERQGVTDLQKALDAKLKLEEFDDVIVEEATEGVYRIAKEMSGEGKELEKGRDFYVKDGKYEALKTFMGKFTTPILTQLIAALQYSELTADKDNALPSQPLRKSLSRVIGNFIELSEMDGVPAFLPLEIVKIAKSTREAKLEPEAVEAFKEELKLKTEEEVKELAKKLEISREEFTSMKVEDLAELDSQKTQFEHFAWVLARSIELKKEAKDKGQHLSVELALMRAYTELRKDDIINSAASETEGKKRWLELLDTFMRCLFGRILAAAA